MEQRRRLAWLGGAASLVIAVLLLRESQPVPEPNPPGPAPALLTTVTRFAADGVLLPEPDGPPAAVASAHAVPGGPGRLRVAWADALPGGTAPTGAAGYDVRWRAVEPPADGPPADGSPGDAGERLVAAPEVELDGLRPGVRYAIEVRTVDAFGRRSSAAATAAVPSADPVRDLHRFGGMAERFDGPFSVDEAVVGARWHLSGYPGCTRAATDGGMLAVELDCGADLAVLRARSAMRLEPAGERGRVLVVTDGAGRRGSLTIDLVPGPADRVGVQRGGVRHGGVRHGGVQHGGVQHGGTPSNGAAAVDPALPDGTLRVLIDDGGARIRTGPAVPRLAAPPTPIAAPVRGIGVLHAFEVVLDDTGLWVLQDGVPVAAAGVAAPSELITVLVGIGGPDGQRARVRVDTVAFTGPPAPDGPPSYTHPVVPATQRVLGTGEVAPGIGISRERLAGAGSARFVATVRTAPGVDLERLVLQQADAVVPVRPVTTPIPAGPGAEVTVAADLLPDVLAVDGPAAVSPLVLRAPGAESAMVPITDSYLEIVPVDTRHLPRPTSTRSGRPATVPAVPRPSITLLDTESRVASTVAPGSRLVVVVQLDGLAGQLGGGARLAGIAGFQLWLSGRQIAGVPTAFDGAGVGGTYRIALSTRALRPGRQTLELRLIASSPAVSPASVLASWLQS